MKAKKLNVKLPKSERWIPGFIGEYSVTRGGIVFSYLMREKRRKAYSGNKYPRFTYGRRNHMYVHRAVAMTYIKNPFGHREVNHLNGDRNDNRVKNLEWCTRQMNADHAKTKGLFLAGEDHPLTRVKEKEVIEIRESKARSMVLAKKFNVCQGTIDNIRAKRTWKYLK